MPTTAILVASNLAWERADRFDGVIGSRRGSGRQDIPELESAAPELSFAPDGVLQPPLPEAAALDNTPEYDEEGFVSVWPRQDMALALYLDRWEQTHGQEPDFDAKHDENTGKVETDFIVYQIEGYDDGADPHLLVVYADGRTIRSSSLTYFPVA